LAGRLAARAAELGRWWRAELRAGLTGLRPGRATADRPEPPPLRLLLRPDAQGLGLSLMARGAELSAERIAWAEYRPGRLAEARARAAAAGGRPVPLSLALPHAVGRSLTLPRRALAQAEAIVRAEIGRKTPLRPDEIALACAVGPAAGERVRVHYLVVPASLLDRTLARLGLSRSEIASLEGSASLEGAALVLPFGGARAPSGPSAGRAAAALGAACLALVLTGFCGLAGRQAALLGDLEAQMAAVAEPARGSAARLSRVHGLIDAAGELAGLRAAPGVVALWEELARLLPGTTYLTEISVTGSGVELAGYSEAAAELIGRLQGSHLLQGPVLVGPIVFDKARARERFAIRA
ncbi:PilN domain-containing protein, partial [Methylobacterium oxalidis]|uniref:PilN domain-containing protein n=1 Tax=Methylobacterium oxalidis TaxID=944322 RepID=UPI0033152A49